MLSYIAHCYYVASSSEEEAYFVNFFNGGALFLSDKRLHSSHYYRFSPSINLVFTPTPPRLKKIRVGTKIKILAPVTKIKAHNEFPFHYVCPIFT